AIQPGVAAVERSKKSLELARDLRLAEHRRLQAAQNLEQETVSVAVDQRSAGARPAIVDGVGEANFAKAGAPDRDARRDGGVAWDGLGDGEAHLRVILKNPQSGSVTSLSEIPTSEVVYCPDV